ncbi:branched-chain amino acid ABC transporter permease [Paraburkholderia ferrariae]|uniref:branched-chain amino acid ABC transporter permease n=1 Tax=Paraburkholderia ferrariae TaxID=386056 RepID=UPI000694D722|nr:branched-chain amino acid ABC transporter permease [Paraburkholderia ferrariae]
MNIRNMLPGAVLLGLVVALLASGSGDPRQITEILLVFAMAQGWNLLCGYTGLLSLGHHAFVGIGAYALFMATNLLGISPFAGLGASVVASVLTAAAMAVLLQRFRDAYFSIAIWVLADCMRLVFGQWDLAGGARGLVLDATRLDPATLAVSVLWAAAALAFVTFAGLFWMLRSRLGLALSAIRDNEQGAAGVGIATRRCRLLAFVLSATVCGLAGGIYYLSVLYIDPAGAFDIDWQIRIIFIVVVGGVGTLEGPFVGTAIYFALRAMFQGHGEWFAICEGGIAMAVMLLAPGGLWGSLQRRFGWRVFPITWAARRSSGLAQMAGIRRHESPKSRGDAAL